MTENNKQPATNTEAQSPSALEGIKILDLTRLLPGGFCTQMLGDLGADVLKIEDTGQGDYIRWREPKTAGHSTAFVSLNRNKRSMTINLKTGEGREILYKLAKDADVFVESFRPGVMKRLGADYDTINEINPRMVYCSITGYGQTGPYRDRPGHDINFCGLAGVTGITGLADGTPVIPGIQAADIGGGGMPAAFAILAALMARDRTGRGQYIDISMFDGTLSLLTLHATAYFVTGEVPGPQNMRLNGRYACFNVYKTADHKWMTMGGIEPQFWKRFCELLRIEHLIERQFDEENQQDIIKEVAETIGKKTQKELLGLFKNDQVCLEPVQNFDEIFNSDPHVKERELVIEMKTPDGQTMKALANPIKFSHTPWRVYRTPPDYGEHTDDVLNSMGYDEKQIADLRDKGVIK